jgi:hypothetical protein
VYLSVAAHERVSNRFCERWVDWLYPLMRVSSELAPSRPVTPVSSSSTSSAAPFAVSGDASPDTAAAADDKPVLNLLLSIVAQVLARRFTTPNPDSSASSASSSDSSSSSSSGGAASSLASPRVSATAGSTPASYKSVLLNAMNATAAMNVGGASGWDEQLCKLWRKILKALVHLITTKAKQVFQISFCSTAIIFSTSFCVCLLQHHSWRLDVRHAAWKSMWDVCGVVEEFIFRRPVSLSTVTAAPASSTSARLGFHVGFKGLQDTELACPLRLTAGLLLLC